MMTRRRMKAQAAIAGRETPGARMPRILGYATALLLAGAAALAFANSE